jgi:arylformamidase
MASSPDSPWIDISRPLSPQTACWPGDVPYTFSPGSKISDGASVNLGSVTTSVHTATHCDAPFHFDDNGVTVDHIQLEVFLGPAWVIDVRHCLDDWVAALLPLSDQTIKRVLFRTGGWHDTSHFPVDIPVMQPQAIEWLAAHDVTLIGVDLPSVDELDSKDLPNHHALGLAGITIVEGLWLEDVRAGEYELVAAPLKLIGTDGAPLRALLKKWKSS